MTISSLSSQALDSALAPILAVREAIRKRWKKKMKQRRGRFQDLQRAVRPLPSIRQRSLTLPLPDDDAKNGVLMTMKNKNSSPSTTTNPQSRSNFFNMLPPELRLKIYSHVFGYDRVRIVKDERRRYVNWIPQRDRPLLQILLTCRRVYSEAIDLLYSQPEFYFNDFDTICLFASSILPHRRNLIQRIAVEWDCVCYWMPGLRVPPPYDKYTWDKVWEILAGMNGLRELRVRIWNGPQMDIPTELRVFQPLKEVKCTQVFELELPWNASGENHEADVHADAPFKITRVHKDYDADA